MAVTPFLCERYGRRYPIALGSAIVIIFVVLQTASQNYAMFVVSRLFIGFGLGIVQVCSPLLIAETAYPTHRAKMTAIWDSTYALGSVVASWAVYGTLRIDSDWSWRLPSAIQAIPSIIQFCLSFVVPESPRWLVDKGQTEKAIDVLANYHSGGDRDNELVRFELNEIAATIELEKLHGTSGWKEWIATRGDIGRLQRVIFLSFAVQLCGNGTTSYYLTVLLDTIGITTSKTQLVINGCLSIMGFLVAVACALSLDKFGRRSMLILSFSTQLIAFVIWTILSAVNQERDFKDKSLAQGIVGMMFIFQAGYHLCSPTVPTYIMEISKYSLRSKASTMYQLFGNVAGIFNSFVTPIAMEHITWKYYIICAILLAIWLVVTIVHVPETKGRTLEEVSVLFDGPDAIAEHAAAAADIGQNFDEKLHADWVERHT
jgi:sugar porter (SP) family MFS transporter